MKAEIEKQTTDHHRSLSEQITAIASLGLRQMMTFYADYSWIRTGHTYGLTGPIARFAQQYPVGLMTFILGGNRLFSQVFSRFPNIYLVNAKISSSLHGPPSPHTHSYWLKRLIVHYMAGRDRDIEITASRIFDVFHADGMGYERHLIEECLGSLQEANCSNMLRVEHGRLAHLDDLQVSRMYLTQRGLNCAEYIFDRFFYLQL
ncbi:MAG: hypothetical protein ABI614_14990, partial [Planctomycetota bacterium]